MDRYAQEVDGGVSEAEGGRRADRRGRTQSTDDRRRRVISSARRRGPTNCQHQAAESQGAQLQRSHARRDVTPRSRDRLLHQWLPVSLRHHGDDRMLTFAVHCLCIDLTETRYIRLASKPSAVI